MIYIITLIIMGLLLYKFKFFRSGFFSFKWVIKFLISTLLVYFILWSFVNYWFYINVYILMNNFNYTLAESVNIAINLTNEVSSFFYYISLLFDRTLNNLGMEIIYNNLKNQIQPIIDAYGGLSEINSSLDALFNFVKFIF